LKNKGFLPFLTALSDQERRILQTSYLASTPFWKKITERWNHYVAAPALLMSKAYQDLYTS
jgi:hypothetical protein